MASAVLLSSGVCNAESFIQYNYDSKSVKLTADNLVPGDFFTVHIGIGDTFSEENPPKISKMFLADKETSEYIIPIKQGFESGKYDILISSMNGGKAEHKTLIIYDTSSDEAKTLAGLLNTASDFQEFKTILSDPATAAILGIDSEIGAQYDKIIAYLYTLSCADSKSYSADDYAFAFGYSKAKVTLDETEDADGVMKEFASYFGCAYDDYNSLSKDIKKEFDKVIISREISDGFAVFDEIVKVAAIRASDSYGDVKDIIEQNERLFGVDMSSGSDFSDIPKSKRYKVFYEIYNERDNLYSLDDVKEMFDKAVDKVLGSQSNTGGGGNGKGSSSGSSSKGYGSGLPDVTYPNNTEPMQESNHGEIATKPSTAVSLFDVSSHFAKDSIEKLCEMGILNGFPDNTFRPDDEVTRAQFCKIITEAFSLSGVGKAFDDVDQSHWAYSYISAANANSIVNGDGQNFYPDNSLSRQDAAVIIYNILKMQGKNPAESATFNDEDSISDYAKEAVSKLAGGKILLGYDGSFAPLRTITRGEAAIIIDRVLSE